MIRNRCQPSSYISYILTVSPASFNFCLIGHPNEKKKKEKKKRCSGNLLCASKQSSLGEKNSCCSPLVFKILFCRIILSWCKIDTSFDFKSMNVSERVVLQSSDSLVSWEDFAS